MKDINIKGVLNGWVVKVGCSEVVFNDLDNMVSEIKRYIENSVDVEKEYQDNSINKNENFVINMGSNTLTFTNSFDAGENMTIEEILTIDYEKEIEIIESFIQKLIDNSVDLEPEYSKIVDENFWDLI